MDKNEVKKINIDLNLKPSPRLGTKVVISLFDYLLHSRSQIPFHFELFKSFIESKANSGVFGTQKLDWKTEKQLKIASETYEKICALKEIIELEFLAGSPLMLIFGSTIHTAKESYLIQFPSTNENTLPTLYNETTLVRRILLRLIENDELKACDKNLLHPTNVFALFKKPETNDDNSSLSALKCFQLPKSCRKFAIQFRDSSDFDIFEDFKDLSLNTKEKTDLSLDHGEWYQSKIYVKGFKDILVNNKSIWN